jgi:hypothetical protein
MKFFIPAVSDPEKAEQLYQAIKKSAVGSITDRRIRSITYGDERKHVRDTVGTRQAENGEIVLAILDSTAWYQICTRHGGLPEKDIGIMVNKEEVIDVEDFEP